jgi:pimeloyl-ACP methyl ester carboxylesterase
MPKIILIHGMWMNGVDMSLLRYRLRRYGYKVVQFSYSTMRCDLIQSAQQLQQFCLKQKDPTIHYVAHSLGGLLLRHFFHMYHDQRPGRVVTLGTPHSGSLVARKLGRNKVGRHLLGKSLHRGLSGDVPAWNNEHEIGVIAGTLSAGVGRLITHLPRPNDGTVALAEAPLEGMKDYKVMPITHMSMLILPQVVKEVHHFIMTGSFCPA